MGVIGEAVLKEIEEADKANDGDRLLPLLEYAITRAREQFYARGGKIIHDNHDEEYLPTIQRG